MKNSNPHFLARIFQFTSEVKPEEFRLFSRSFLLILILMCAYYIIRPLRDGLASDWTDAEVSFLWTLNFFISAATIAMYGWVVTKTRFDLLVPSVYAFFGLSFVVFYLGTTLSIERIKWLDQAFYVWLSVFSLFNVSVFWSFVSDRFTVDQSTRLFPLLGAGASLGAIIGPSIPALFTGLVGTEQLLLISSLLIILATLLVFAIQRLGQGESGIGPRNLESQPIGGNPFAGFRDFIKNPQLMNIAFFIILYTMISSFIYFMQKNLLEEFDLAQRTEILAIVDWSVNILTFVIALFVTGRLVKVFGMPITLSCIPFVVSTGMFFLALVTTLALVLFLQIIRRAGNYAMTRPARERLFTKVIREERFKAKPVIDILAYRGGDMVTSWTFAGLTEGIGFGLSSMAFIGGSIALIWAVVAIVIGKKFEKQLSL